MNKCLLTITVSALSLACSNFAVASPLDTSHIHTQHTLGLKPISNLQKSFNLAAATFLPDAEDGFGFSSDKLDDSHGNSAYSCSGFALSSCPAHAKCSKCTFGSKYKITGCETDYKQSGNACVAKTCSEINAAYKAEVPANQVCAITKTSVRSCYSSCKNIDFSGYPLDSCPSGAVCTPHPDCGATATAKGNCSPLKQKVTGCTSSVQKVNSTATACIDKDDACPADYFKTCDTGTQGDPKYTEKGSACYQCKPKENCPSDYYASSPQTIIYGDECENKRSNYHVFDTISTFLYNSNLRMPNCTGRCKKITADITYGKYTENADIRYYEPTAAQTASPETVVDTCAKFKTALADSNVYNIRISGTVSCDDREYFATAEKHIFGQDKNKRDILEFTNKNVVLSAPGLRFSNLTLKAMQRTYGFLRSSAPDGEHNGILPVAENVDIIGNNGSLRNDIFFKSGSNHLYQEAYGATDGIGSGIMVVGPDAEIYFHGSDRATVNFAEIFLFGKIIPVNNIGISYSTPAASTLYMKGNNKTYRGKTLNNGAYLEYGSWPATWLYIVGNNSSISSTSSDGSNINIAVGDGSVYHAPAATYGKPNVAMGKSAQYNGISTSGNYSGEYTYVTTGDTSKFYYN